MGTTLGDTGGRREQNLLKVCALMYKEKMKYVLVFDLPTAPYLGGL